MRHVRYFIAFLVKKVMSYCLSRDHRDMVISIFYVDYDSAGAGQLLPLSMVFGLHYNGVFICFLDVKNDHQTHLISLY